MERFLRVLKCLAVVLVTWAGARVAFAADGDCYIYIYRANGVTYLEYRPGYPVCHPTTCDNPLIECHDIMVRVGGHDYKMCVCASYNSGCRLGYRGSQPVGGVAECVSFCPEGQHCEEVQWHGQWIYGKWVETAYPCAPCTGP